MLLSRLPSTHGRMTKIAFHICNITETGRELLDSEPLPSLVLPSVRVIHVKVRQVGYAQLVRSQQCRERLFPHCCPLSQNQ